MYKLIDNKQRYTTVLFIGLLMCFSVTSCSESEQWEDSDVVAVSFTTLLSDSGLPDTRVVNDKWTGGETVYISMMDPGKTALTTPTASFNTYTAKTTSPYTSATLDPGTGQTLYYPITGQKVNFVAYSPAHSAKTNNEVTYTGFADQSTKAKMEAKDFIWCKTSGEGYNYKSASVPLKFDHKFCKLVIKVKRDASVTTDAFNKLALTVGSIPTSVKIPLDTGTPATATTPATLVPFREVTIANNEITYTAVVPQHTAERTVTFGGVSSPALTHKIGDKFESGWMYEYTFTLAAKSVTISGSTIEKWEGGAASWNGQYVIRSAEPEIDLDVYKATGTLLVSTNCPDPLESAITSGSGWLGASCTKVSESGEWRNYELTYNASGNATTGSRPGNIRLLITGLSLDIPVTQRAGSTKNLNIDLTDRSNCFILPPQGYSVYIPAGAVVKNFNENYCDGVPYDIGTYEMVADVLWSDVSANGYSSGVVSPGSAVSAVEVLGKGANAVIKVTSGEKPGNVLIAFRDKSTETIRWSFHMWVTDFDPVATAVTVGGVTAMNRNLGALFDNGYTDYQYGVHYQYGRKDPIPGVPRSGTTVESYVWLKTEGVNAYTKVQPYANRATTNFVLGTTAVTIATSIAQPWGVYTAAAGSYYTDWCTMSIYSTPNNNYRWKSANAFDDPCPNGWYVFTKSQWNKWHPSVSSSVSNNIIYANATPFPMLYGRDLSGGLQIGLVEYGPRPPEYFRIRHISWMANYNDVLTYSDHTSTPGIWDLEVTSMGSATAGYHRALQVRCIKR